MKCCRHCTEEIETSTVLFNASWNNKIIQTTDKKHQLIIKQNTITKITVQYSTVQYSTVQYSTVQYSTVQYSTVQYSTVQYSTVQYSTVIMKCINQFRFEKVSAEIG